MHGCTKQLCAVKINGVVHCLHLMLKSGFSVGTGIGHCGQRESCLGWPSSLACQTSGEVLCTIQWQCVYVPVKEIRMKRPCVDYMWPHVALYCV